MNWGWDQVSLSIYIYICVRSCKFFFPFKNSNSSYLSDPGTRTQAGGEDGEGEMVGFYTLPRVVIDG